MSKNRDIVPYGLATLSVVCFISGLVILTK